MDMVTVRFMRNWRGNRKGDVMYFHPYSAVLRHLRAIGAVKAVSPSKAKNEKEVK